MKLQYLSMKKLIKLKDMISHISGDNAVSSCVVFNKSGALKKDYRLFNIPRHLSGNDVGSLEHVLEED